MKFENSNVYNFESAVRGVRNPMNSWNKSDSWWSEDGTYTIGWNDMKLLQNLLTAGDASHSKFMRQIFVSVDIEAPLYYWSEMDTYKVGTVANSCSTMHKLASIDITIDCFEPAKDGYESAFIKEQVIPHLKKLQDLYNETKDINYFRELKGCLPSSWLQKRTWTANYEVLRNIIKQRRNHRLREWSVDFINWCHTLPYADELLFYGIEKNEK